MHTCVHYIHSPECVYASYHSFFVERFTPQRYIPGALFTISISMRILRVGK